MCHYLSLPLWECGLKFSFVYQNVIAQLSLPLWECGLKFPCIFLVPLRFHVTPLVGVWIEIVKNIHYQNNPFVTPLVGVWIEISLANIFPQAVLVSLPLWECGLKYTGGKC